MTLNPPDRASTSSISWPLNRPPERGPWQPGVTPANGHAHSAAPSPAYPPAARPATPAIWPDGPYPLAGIALRALLLGLAMGAATVLALGATLLLPGAHAALWRAPFFVAAVALFHALEYLTTARYNPRLATPSAFLFSQNGAAYHVAHALALLETLLVHTLLPYPRWLPTAVGPLLPAAGLALMVLGQVVRSVAMAEAGTNFNHTVQQHRAHGHELVTTGIYAWLRHPSYFGFFWWGLGSQLVLGNVVCLVGYAMVLWRFFSRRIERESSNLFTIALLMTNYVQVRRSCCSNSLAMLTSNTGRVRAWGYRSFLDANVRSMKMEIEILFTMPRLLPLSRDCETLQQHPRSRNTILSPLALDYRRPSGYRSLDSNAEGSAMIGSISITGYRLRGPLQGPQGSNTSYAIQRSDVWTPS